MLGEQTRRSLRLLAGAVFCVGASAACLAGEGPPAGRILAPAYAEVADGLRPYIVAEMERHRLPAISVALIDDQQIVWAEGFGVADPDAGVAATSRTVYRVGSVSKLFTDIAVMQRVEEGRLDLDTPVTDYLPELTPRNPFADQITLRHLMAHRAGMVREPPLGHYFDPSAPSLADTVSSIADTTLVYPPGERTKYSNAGVAAVGRVLEHVEQTPFAEILRRDLLTPLEMTSSSFAPTPEIIERRARGLMWGIDGREFAAPTFELGMAPAGGMYSTVEDLGLFISALFAGGEGAGGRVLQAPTLERMWEPQFTGPGQSDGFGLGFRLGTLAGQRRIGHGGAIYGFATELAMLPDEKLGAVVVTTRDVANPITDAVADGALLAMLALRQGQPIPVPDPTPPLYEGLAARIAGRGASSPSMPPPPPPQRWRGLIGEYGWSHDVLFVLELDAELHALIEWFFLYPLEEIAEDVFRFPDGGLYDGEPLVFERDDSGHVVEVILGGPSGVAFPRRPIGTAAGETFRIEPVRPVEQLRREALAADPPVEEGDLREPDLVDVTGLEPGIRLDIRYATTNNFMGAAFYDEPRAFLQRPAAEALARAHRALAASGYGLLVHDAYRPWHVTKMFWEATPEQQKMFVADPAGGSRHNRGAAVDLTLYELESGEPVRMVGGYDEFTERSYPDYPGGTARQRWHRELLRSAMEAEGFAVYQFEWWHFDYDDWASYPILDLTFEQVDANQPPG